MGLFSKKSKVSPEEQAAAQEAREVAAAKREAAEAREAERAAERAAERRTPRVHREILRLPEGPWQSFLLEDTWHRPALKPAVLGDL